MTTNGPGAPAKTPAPTANKGGKVTVWVETHKPLAVGVIVLFLGVLYLVSRSRGTSGTATTTTLPAASSTDTGTASGGYGDTGGDPTDLGQLLSLFATQGQVLTALQTDQANQDAAISGISSDAQTAAATAASTQQAVANQAALLAAIPTGAGGAGSTATGSLGTVMTAVMSSPAATAQPSSSANNAAYQNAVNNLAKALGHPVSEQYLSGILGGRPVDQAYVIGIGGTTAQADALAKKLNINQPKKPASPAKPKGK